MQENFEIEAVSRSDQGKGASRRLRREGLVPGIIYGGGKDPEMFATKHNELIQHLEHEAFYSHILTVKVDGKGQRVVLKDLQRHPAKPFVVHVDLLRVAESDRIKMHVPLHFLNEASCPGVKAGGQVSHTISDVEVICAAKDLPEYIEVDLGNLNLGDILHLTDLKMPEGVALVALSHGDPAEHDAAVVSIHAARGGAGEAGEEEETPAE
ncbi:MAG: 50S ribosomal protein L25/general stress protein Ctc [Chromatiaceae bacterium]|nr:50S ribosomal protein L25/general stress protein Ctc [Gammaproteobacteria bacterium]MCP5307070.1 50S ribosomal protein L25/general stress protein Ctc [Chromatiaceae bacterium]MCP5314553.1 50S ribosomal protein L25/general stress protein Ctc [Chromatiaceae bacterium]